MCTNLRKINKSKKWFGIKKFDSFDLNHDKTVYSPDMHAESTPRTWEWESNLEMNWLPNEMWSYLGPCSGRRLYFIHRGVLFSHVGRDHSSKSSQIEKKDLKIKIGDNSKLQTLAQTLTPLNTKTGRTQSTRDEDDRLWSVAAHFASCNYCNFLVPPSMLMSL